MSLADLFLLGICTGVAGWLWRVQARGGQGFGKGTAWSLPILLIGILALLAFILATMPLLRSPVEPVRDGQSSAGDDRIMKRDATYRVRPRDTMELISRRYDLDCRKLLVANPEIVEPSVDLKQGMVLKIPLEARFGRGSRRRVAGCGE